MYGQEKNDDANNKDKKENQAKSGEQRQQEEIEITITAMMMIPAHMQTYFNPKGETLDRQWVGRQIQPVFEAKQKEKCLGPLIRSQHTTGQVDPLAPRQLHTTAAAAAEILWMTEQT